MAVGFRSVKRFENTNFKIDFKSIRRILWVLEPTSADSTAKNIPISCLGGIANIREKLLLGQK